MKFLMRKLSKEKLKSENPAVEKATSSSSITLVKTSTDQQILVNNTSEFLPKAADNSVAISLGDNQPSVCPIYSNDLPSNDLPSNDLPSNDLLSNTPLWLETMDHSKTTQIHTKFPVFESQGNSTVFLKKTELDCDSVNDETSDVAKKSKISDDEEKKPVKLECDPVNSVDRVVAKKSDSIDECGGNQNIFEELRPIRNASKAEAHVLFCKKLEMCCVVYDLSVDNFSREKEVKRQTLLELIEYVSNCNVTYTETMIKSMVTMVSKNIFRSFVPPRIYPTSALYGLLEQEEEDSTLELCWPHLQMVYELFLRFLVSSDLDLKYVKKFVNKGFVLKLLDLFSSEDPRERDYLKSILHRIYGKMMHLRPFIRKAIQNSLYALIYENERYEGIAELLEILGSIINGFALPLKEEHKIFLEKALIPLHKTRSVIAFHQQLTYCMTQYVEKDNHLSEMIIMGLLRYWPVTNTSKEVFFLNELEEILDLTQPAEFEKVMLPLFKQVASCIQSPHFQVAERVLFFWNNEYIVTLFNSNKEMLFPIVITALFKNSRDHWNRTVHGLTYTVSKLLAKADPKLFNECSVWSLVNGELQASEEEAKESQWKRLEYDFCQKYQQINEKPAV